ncbi:MAG: hypothetical protein U1E77_09545 [Inhella sp.]
MKPSPRPAASITVAAWPSAGVLTAGLGGMGGARPLACNAAPARSTSSASKSRIDFRLKTRYVDEQAKDLDDALARITKYTAEKKAISIALLEQHATEILPRTRQTPKPAPPSSRTS